MRLVRSHGIGNDYLVLDSDHVIDAEAVRALCDRHRGVGGDGVLEGVGRICSQPCQAHEECGPPACGNASISCAGTDGDVEAGEDQHCLLFCSPPHRGTQTDCPDGSTCVLYDQTNYYYVCAYPL